MGNRFSHHLLIHLHSCINTLNDVEAAKLIIFNIWLNCHYSIKTSMPRNLKLMICLLCPIAEFILLFLPTHQEIWCCLSMLDLCRSSQLSFGTCILAGGIQSNVYVYYTHTVPIVCVYTWVFVWWWWYNSVLLILPIFKKFAFFHSHSFDLFDDDIVQYF